MLVVKGHVLFTTSLHETGASEELQGQCFGAIASHRKGCGPKISLAKTLIYGYSTWRRDTCQPVARCDPAYSLVTMIQKQHIFTLTCVSVRVYTPPVFISSTECFVCRVISVVEQGANCYTQRKSSVVYANHTCFPDVFTANWAQQLLLHQFQSTPCVTHQVDPCLKKN